MILNAVYDGLVFIDFEGIERIAIIITRGSG
jgi:hypothetical protein